MAAVESTRAGLRRLATPTLIAVDTLARSVFRGVVKTLGMGKKR